MIKSQANIATRHDILVYFFQANVVANVATSSPRARWAWRWVPSIMLISRMAVNYKVEWCPWLRVVNLENLELDSELLGPLRDLYVFTTQSQRQSCMWGAAGIFPNPMVSSERLGESGALPPLTPTLADHDIHVRSTPQHFRPPFPRPLWERYMYACGSRGLPEHSPLW